MIINEKVNRTRVALVVPKCNIPSSDTCAPLNLGYLASYLRKHVPDVEVAIIDGMVGDVPLREIFNFQPDIVGVTATTPQAPEAYRLADCVKANRPDILVVIGGVHASALPEEAALHADVVVTGEGERALVDIVRKWQNKQTLPKIIEGEYVENLDEIPSPAFDLLKMKEYLKHGAAFPRLKHPIVSIVTSRGCLFRCPFCHNSFRSYPPRWFSAKRIADEIEFFISEYGVKSVFFHDDEFLVNMKRLKELAVLFEERGINKKIVWGCKARVNTISNTALELAKKMGCVSIFQGYESGCQRILDYLKCKTITVEAAEKAISMVNEKGIVVGGSFIFGTPTETLQEMKQTAKWLEANDGLKFITINSMIPYPKTAVWKLAKRKGLLPEKMDYAKLVAGSAYSEVYINNDAVPAKVFNRFIVDIQRVAWILTQTRLKPTLKDFFKLSKQKTWWWMWLFHPVRMVRLMQKVASPHKTLKALT